MVPSGFIYAFYSVSYIYFLFFVLSVICRFATRLVDIKENNKFKEPVPDDACTNMSAFVKSIKHEYGIK